MIVFHFLLDILCPFGWFQVFVVFKCTHFRQFQILVVTPSERDCVYHMVILDTDAVWKAMAACVLKLSNQLIWFIAHLIEVSVTNANLWSRFHVISKLLCLKWTAHFGLSAFLYRKVPRDALLCCVHVTQCILQQALKFAVVLKRLN